MATTTRFAADYGKRAAGCKKCKMQLEKGSLRMAKIVPNPFVQRDDGRPPPDMKQYFHVNCLFEMLFKARVTTKVIEDREEIEGFEDLKEEDQEEIGKLVDELVEKRGKDGDTATKTPKSVKRKKQDDDESSPDVTPEKKKELKQKTKEPEKIEREIDETSKFNMFYKFCKLCKLMEDEAKEKGKVAVLREFINDDAFSGDIAALLTLLLRKEDKRKYKEISEETLLKIFADILEKPLEELKEALAEKEDVSIVIKEAIEGTKVNPKSDWSIQKVDRWMERLVVLNNDACAGHWKFATKKLSPVEIEYLIRLVHKDLKTGATKRNILDAINKNASEVYKKKGLQDVVARFDKKDWQNTPAKKTPAKRGRFVKEEEEEEEEERDDEESEPEEDSEDDSKETLDPSESESEVESSSEEEDEDDVENFAVEKCPAGRVACTYGKDCYRKNRDHLKEFWHPRRV